MLTIHNLCVRYGSRSVLKHLDLHVKAGEFVHILGGNGAGKSTLFKALLKKHPYKEGSIQLNGVSYSKLSKRNLAQRVSHVSQNTLEGTIPSFTIQENMEIATLRGKVAPLSFRNPDIQYMKNQLKLCEMGLEDRLNIKAEDLSGGQRQALCLIMALQNAPELLLLDEHTSALDPKAARRIMRATHKILAENKMTCLMITHNLQDAIDYGDRIVILDNGHVAHEIHQDEKASLTPQILIERMIDLETQHA